MLKQLRSKQRPFGLLMVLLMLTWQVGQPLHAATLYWDADTIALGNSITGANLGGSGTWNTTNTNWWDGSSSTDTIAAFGSGDTAVVSGLGGIVLLSSPFSLGGLHSTKRLRDRHSTSRVTAPLPPSSPSRALERLRARWLSMWQALTRSALSLQEPTG